MLYNAFQLARNSKMPLSTGASTSHVIHVPGPTSLSIPNCISIGSSVFLHSSQQRVHILYNLRWNPINRRLKKFIAAINNIALYDTKQRDSNETKFLSEHQLSLCQVTQVDNHQQILQASQQTLFVIINLLFASNLQSTIYITSARQRLQDWFGFKLHKCQQDFHLHHIIFADKGFSLTLKAKYLV